MSGRQIVSKVTVQALLAVIVTVAACWGFYADRIDGPAFLALCFVAFQWAYGNKRGSAD